MRVSGNIAGPSATAGDFRLSCEEMRFFEEKGYVGPFKCFDDDLGEGYARLILEKKKKYRLLDDEYQKSRGGRFQKIRDVLSHKADFAGQTAHDGMQRLLGIRGPRGKARFWYKSTQFLIPEVAKLALMPAISQRMQDILGDDLLLWGAQVMNKQGKSHRWHEDVEHAEWRGATVWAGIDNVGPGNTMKVIPGSHHFDFSPQELAARGADLTSDESLLAALRKVRPDAQVVTIDMKPGYFFIFAGRTWHASHDVTDKFRTALIFQYCPPSERVRVPRSFEPPNVRFYPAQPWVMQVAGQDRFGVNHIKPAPPGEARPWAGRTVMVIDDGKDMLSGAARLASQGARVVLFGDDRHRLTATKKLLEFLYDAEVAIQMGNAGDSAAVDEGLKVIAATLGPVDALVNSVHDHVAG